MREGSLFTGYNGLGLAAESVLDCELTWVCDNDPAAMKVLTHRYPSVPNLGDITTVDWALVDPVDVLTAGWPCQPWSLAGQQKGLEDDRALWPEVVRAIRVLRPRLVLLENVPGCITAGELGRAADSLADLGYEFAWTVLGADAVGAPHRRDRLFIAATNTSRSGKGSVVRAPGLSLEPGGSFGLVTARQADADPASLRDSGGSESNQRGQADDLQSSHWGIYGAAIRHWGMVIERSAPDPAERGRRGSDVLSPAFVEWLMGLPKGWVTNVPGLSCNQQLKLLGNGVVPQQATAAYAYLLGLLTSSEVAA